MSSPASLSAALCRRRERTASQVPQKHFCLWQLCTEWGLGFVRFSNIACNVLKSITFIWMKQLICRELSIHILPLAVCSCFIFSFSIIHHCLLLFVILDYFNQKYSHCKAAQPSQPCCIANFSQRQRCHMKVSTPPEPTKTAQFAVCSEHSCNCSGLPCCSGIPKHWHVLMNHIITCQLPTYMQKGLHPCFPPWLSHWVCVLWKQWHCFSSTEKRNPSAVHFSLLCTCCWYVTFCRSKWSVK